MKASPAENEQATWTTPECPFAISYSLRVLDDIRLAVTDAFFSLPRGGAEIGGLLLGAFDGGQVVISGHAPIDVEHAFGPSFTLSARDEAQLADSIHRCQGRVMGWYHSHTRSEIFLPESDQALHRRFFPEPWQVALVLKPHTFQPMRGGFFFREESGAIHGAASYREFSLGALPLRPVPSGEPPIEPVRSRVDTNFTGRVITVEASLAESHSPSVPTEAEPATDSRMADSDLPKFETVEPAKSRSWWVAALCVLLGSALGAWAFQTRALWLQLLDSNAATRTLAPAAVPAPVPTPPHIGLSASEKDAQLTIRWNREEPPVRSASSAVLAITDGDDTRTIPLDREHLLSGFVIYIRRAERVDVSMTLQQPVGQPLRESIQFEGKLPAAPQDPELVQRVDHLKVQNDKLKAALRRQAERARQAEKSLEEMRKARKRLGNQLPGTIK